ncbi:hypothetical protein Pmani_032445 [Petrolisthes manimaculis]|uniref:Uncharacterized protein n=1 Tax=Petrolisthes manimaculis TaxID=1843537 RepID=A0AAE1TTS6_9EUCA|nr:hypothetical protein Pmani_032445 [Petrolisthes manimaculis]
MLKSFYVQSRYAFLEVPDLTTAASRSQPHPSASRSLPITLSLSTLPVPLLTPVSTHPTLLCSSQLNSSHPSCLTVSYSSRPCFNLLLPV